MTKQRLSPALSSASACWWLEGCDGVWVRVWVRVLVLVPGTASGITLSVGTTGSRSTCSVSEPSAPTKVRDPDSDREGSAMPTKASRQRLTCEDKWKIKARCDVPSNPRPGAGG